MLQEFEQFHNKKIAILGYGREGKSSLQFLLNIGVPTRNITILDGAKKIEGLVANFEYLAQTFGIEPEFNITFGDNYLDNLKEFDVIIKTPGISLYHPKIYPYKHKITSQAQIFFDYYQGKVIAITGTKGKSTTCTLVYETLKAAGKRAVLIGNIGKPVLNFLDIHNLSSQKDEYAVFEISSYMLEELKKSNYISVILNVYADHLDWHQGFENYQKAKFNIIPGSEYTLLRYETMKQNDLEEKDFEPHKVYIFGEQGKYTYHDNAFYLEDKKVFDAKEILLKGEHNMMNICAVLGICDIMHIDPMILYEVLKKFKGLPHRMEYVGIYGGIIWIDDAISTTPESTMYAIKTFGHQIDTIFLGGTDRGYVFDELVKCIYAYGIRNVVLFPDSGKRIAELIKEIESMQENNMFSIRVYHAHDMKDAVQFAYKFTKVGKICLLSTASPSYTLWKNFEEKGNLFQQYIKELA